MVVLGENQYKVDDDSPRHDQLKREDRVDFPDEASPDGLVTEVEASGGRQFKKGSVSLRRALIHITTSENPNSLFQTKRGEREREREGER